MHRFILCVVLGIALVARADPVGNSDLTTQPGNQLQQIDALAKAIAAKGEPILPADFISKPVADADNAVVLLRQAYDAIDKTSREYRDYDALERVRLPLPEEQAQVIHAYVAANKLALDKLAAAMARKDVDWQIKVESPAISVLLPDLGKARGVANLARMAALDACAQGAYGRAMEHVRQALWLSRAVGQQPFLVSHLVGVGCSSLACNTLLDMVPELNIGADARAASPQQAKALIAELLDETSVRQQQRAALMGERMMQLDTARCLLTRKLNWQHLASMTTQPYGAQNFLQWVLMLPTLADEATTAMEFMAKVIAAASSDDCPTAMAKMPDISAGADHPFTRRMVPQQLDLSIRTTFRALADRRMAAAALAARQYALDNGGKFPATLADLVPKYLPAVPLDPMAVKQPLHYDAARAIIYSVGNNGTDEGGSEKPLTPDRTGRWQMEDAVVHLSR